MTIMLIYALITTGTTCAMGYWLYSEHRSRLASERDAARDRAETRRMVETAARDAASCVAVIDRLSVGDASPSPRRRLHVIRDDRNGVSRWQWE